jgi:predicted transcriptional regulator
MHQALNDALNLEILEAVCSGDGVEVNISELSKIFKRHRNTVREQVNALFEYKIINKPIYPFIWLYSEYPLLVISRADLPRNERTEKFLREDEMIFAAFYVRDEEYNTLLIEYFPDIYAYGQWKNRIVVEGRIPPRDVRYPSNTMFFSTHQIIKYMPNSPIFLMEQKYEAGIELEINGYKMNKLCFQIMKNLMIGKGIRTNENYLSQKLKVHRKTIERRLAGLINGKIVADPVCRFPNFFVPPNQILVYSVIEVIKSKDKIIKALKMDHNVPLALEASIGRYNLLLFGVFSNVEEHFEWEERYDTKFPGCFGAMKNIYLSPKKTALVDQQKVSLGIIRRKMRMLNKERSAETIKTED